MGAHPGFPDMVGFGRREIHATPEEVEALVIYQVGALSGVVAAEGGRLRHVKPHGALYNMAARDRRLAEAVARGVRAVGMPLVLVGLSGSRLLDAGRQAGLAVASEVFADRAYDARGQLRDRAHADAVLSDPRAVTQRVVEMVRDGHVRAVDGTQVAVAADTVCVHGDTPGAPSLVAALKEGLERAGILVEGPGNTDQ